MHAISSQKANNGKIQAGQELEYNLNYSNTNVSHYYKYNNR